MVYVTGADCALLNGGGIRASIDAGDITKGEIITVLPFGNYIVTQRVTGAEIKAALEHGTRAYPEFSGGFPHVSGIKFVMDIGRQAGDRVLNISVNGQPLDLNKEYVLATNDFIAAGGDTYTMLVDNPILNEYGALDEALIAYIQEKRTVNPAVEGRITVQETKPETKYYVVKPGDWLIKIAKKFNTTWQKLQELNKLPNPNLIFPGQKIILPD
jgi:2',3'-cyclic-nucleotide 2'-phosphodiesterase (5'-nucleotidase family)